MQNKRKNNFYSWFSVGVYCTIIFFLFTQNTYSKSTIEIIYGDAEKIGFNDPTSVSAVGNNTATTLGEQRKAALNYAVSILEKTFSSSVPIKITTSFSALGGNATSATLASAGPNTLHFDFNNAPISNTYYPSALANKLAQRDLDPNSSDIYANFNNDVDGNLVLGNSNWYYGLDGKPTGNNIDFISVALHELLHGLGFLSLVDVSSGRKFGGRDDVYSNFLNRQNGIPSLFSAMNNSQRTSAIKSTGLLQWIGAITQSNSEKLTAGVTNSRVQIYAPNPIEIGSSVSHLSDQVRPRHLMEPSYTGAHHDFGIATAIMSDIGWGTLADLNLTAQNSAAQSTINTPFTSTFIINNKGSQIANDVTLTIPLSTHLTVIKTMPDQGAPCSTENKKIQCALGNINVNQTLQIIVQLKNSQAETLSLTGSVTSNNIDPDVTNNDTSDSIEFIPSVNEATTVAENTITNYSENTPITEVSVSQQKTGGSISWHCLIIGLLFYLYIILKRRTYAKISHPFNHYDKHYPRKKHEYFISLRSKILAGD